MPRSMCSLMPKPGRPQQQNISQVLPLTNLTTLNGCRHKHQGDWPVLVQAPTEVAAIREVLAQQLVLLHLQAGLLRRAEVNTMAAGRPKSPMTARPASACQTAQHHGNRDNHILVFVCCSAAGATHQQLHCLLATHGDRAGNLLIPANGECAHGVACPPKHRLLPCQLLQHLHASNARSEQGGPWCCCLLGQLSSPAADLPLRCWHLCCCSARPQSNDFSTAVPFV